MLPDGRRLGAHLPLGHGMRKAVDRAVEIGADTLQIFTDNPTAWRRRAEPPRELEAFGQAIDAHGLGPLVSHASYLVNPAGPPGPTWDKALALLVRELEVARSFGVGIVNVHAGSHVSAGEASGVAQAGAMLARALDAAGPAAREVTLLVEDSAGGGDAVGMTPASLAGILRSAEERGVDPGRLGICLDTAHAWGAGLEIGEPDGVDRLLDEIDGRIGLERLRLVHLNDSRSPFGSRTDRHEHLGHGLIPLAGFRRLLTHPRLGHVTYILETPGMDEGYDAINLDRARRIAAGLPLAPLPDDAPTGARSAHVAPDHESEPEPEPVG